MKHWILGTAITFGILGGMNQAMAFGSTSLPSTDVAIEMDSNFKATNKGLKKWSSSTKLEPNNVAWGKSVLTGKIDNELVYRFQTKFGVHNEGAQDAEDQEYYKKSRAEYKVKDSHAVPENGKVTYKYSFYVPTEIELSGQRTHFTGQWKNHKAGVIIAGITVAPSNRAVRVFDDWYHKSQFADKAVQPEDLMFVYRGMLGNDSKGYKSTAIPLANKGEWQGKWHTVEITWHASDNGSFKFVFNGKTIIDCTGCDAMPNENHKEFYQDDWAYDRHDDKIVWQFGAYQYAFDPDRIDPKKNVNTVVYYKDMSITK